MGLGRKAAGRINTCGTVNVPQVIFYLAESSKIIALLMENIIFAASLAPGILSFQGFLGGSVYVCIHE
jgi:hypothetical protein